MSRTPPLVLPTWYLGPASAARPRPSNTVVGGHGLSLTLADGRRFEDWSGTMFVNNIGLGRASMAMALADQAARLAWASPDMLADVRVALAKDLRAILPRSLTTVHYGVGGSDCMEAAIRAARKVTGRKKVVAFSYAYHGDTMVTEALSDGMTSYGDPRSWIIRTASPYEFWESEEDWDGAYAKSLAAFEATLRRVGPRSVAALVVEPFSGSYCGVPVSRDLGAGLRDVCNRHGIKLVSDEVITGFGRTGAWFGSGAAGLSPDAIVMAKGITGGYATLGAVAFESSWAQSLASTGFPHGLTFSGQPVACAAARETIRILRHEGLVQASASKGRFLLGLLQEVAAAHPESVRDVRGRGLMIAVEFRGRTRWRKGSPHPALSRTMHVRASLGRAGIFVYAMPDGGSLLLCPPFVVTEHEMTHFASCLESSLQPAGRK